MAKITVFGGTFDPFTPAHRRIVEALSEKYGMVLIAPTAVDWHRAGKSPWLAVKDRVAVIEWAMKTSTAKWRMWYGDVDRLQACASQEDLDDFMSGRGFVNTLFEIKADRAGEPVELRFAIGSDQLAEFKKWRNWQGVLRLAKMVVVQGRGGKTVETDLDHEEIRIEDEYSDVSATELRERWKDRTVGEYCEWLERELTAEETLLKTPIFDIVKKKPTETGLRPIALKAPDWAAVVVEKGGEWLMTRQRRHGTGKLSLEFPCGTVEKDEPPIVAAYRELKEETGFKLTSYDDMKYLGSYSPNPAFMTNKMHFFYVNLDKAEGWERGETEFDEHESIESKFIQKDKAEAAVLASSDSSCIMLAGILLAKGFSK